jgi:hypothetical protein
MEINFKFGEHFYQQEESFWLFSLLLTMIGTFSGFFLALLLDRRVDKRNKAIKYKDELTQKLDRLNYLKSILDALIEYIPKQLERFKEYSVVLKNHPLEIAVPNIIATYDLIRLTKADNVYTLEAYCNFFNEIENPYKNYKNLFAHGDFLKRELESIEIQTEKAVNFKHKDQLVVRDIFDELSFMILTRLLYLIDKFGGHHNAMKNEEFIFLENLSTEYAIIIKNMISFQKIQDNFLTPLLDSTLQKIENKDLKVKILQLTRKAQNRLNNIGANSDIFANEIEKIELNIDNSFQSLKDETKKIEEKIIKYNNIHYKQ